MQHSKPPFCTTFVHLPSLTFSLRCLLASLWSANRIARRAGRGFGESGVRWYTAVSRRRWNLYNLWLRLAHHRGANFLGLNDRSGCADDFRIGNNSLVVQNFRIWHYSLPVDDTGLHVGSRLIDNFRFHDGFRSWDHMLIHNSAAAVD